MSRSVPGRAVYDHSGFRWWNTIGVGGMFVFGCVLAFQVVQTEGPRGIAFMGVWFGVLAFIGYKLAWSSLYRLEADDRRLYWRRGGTEQSAAPADVASVSTSANLGTIRFRDDRRPLKVMVGGGFQEFLSHLRDQEPDIELGGGRTGFGPFGGGFSRS